MGKKKQKAARLAEAEHDLVGSVAETAHETPVALAGAASEIADQPPLVALSLATIAAGAVLRHRTITRTGARMLVAHAIATGAKSVLKHMIDRARPSRALQDGKAKVGSGRGSEDTDFNSFPSGHTAGAVSVAQAVAHTAPALALPARSAAFAIAAVQLPRGAHYPSDVTVGAIIGWAADRIAGVIVDAAEQAADRAAALTRGEPTPSAKQPAPY
jgi:undecaprenyl-diphosphatase